MNTLTHPTKDFTIEVANHWDELNQRDIRFIFRSVLKHGIPEGFDLCYDTILNHFPEQGKLYGPAHLLSDITFGEFRSALEELEEYFASQSELNSDSESQHALNRFIACLYRPNRKNYKKLKSSESFDGSLREPFNRNLIEKNAHLAKRIPHEVKVIIMMWFTYCVRYIQSEELVVSGRTISLKSLFPSGKRSKSKALPQIPEIMIPVFYRLARIKRSWRTLLWEKVMPAHIVEEKNANVSMLAHRLFTWIFTPKPTEKEKSKSTKSTGGWSSILFAISKEGVFGTIDQSDKVALFDILLYLFDQHEQNQRMKAKYSTKS